MQVSVVFSSGGHRLTRMDFITLDQLGYLPFVQSGGRSYSTLSAGSTSAPQS
jgi:hypothetical protein